MQCVIVPNYVRDAINQKLDAAFLERPDAAADRELFYQQLLRHYDEFGEVPDFDLQRAGGVDSERSV